jgi:hypothetical protein
MARSFAGLVKKATSKQTQIRAEQRVRELLGQLLLLKPQTFTALKTANFGPKNPKPICQSVGN